VWPVTFKTMVLSSRMLMQITFSGSLSVLVIVAVYW